MLRVAQERQDFHCKIVDHPLVRATLAVMRDKNTDTADFSAAVQMLTYHLIFAATGDLQEKTVKIETPLAKMEAYDLASNIVLVPILRSGVGMLDPARAIFPSAPVLAVGVKRDEKTAEPFWYRDLDQLNDLNGGNGSVFLILDPMLATGGSAILVAARIKEYYSQSQIKMVAMISAPEGIQSLNKDFPDIQITTAAVDDHLNRKAYIVPGLGDAGDRQFGTL